MAKPVEAIVRPKGMGLGADRSLTLQQKQPDSIADSRDGRGKEELVMKRGAYCVVVARQHEGMYGQVRI